LGKPTDLMSMAEDIFQTMLQGVRRPEPPTDIRVRLALEKNPNAKEDGT